LQDEAAILTALEIRRAAVDNAAGNRGQTTDSPKPGSVPGLSKTVVCPRFCRLTKKAAGFAAGGFLHSSRKAA
jgi:hypothetical protein